MNKARRDPALARIESLFGFADIKLAEMAEDKRHRRQRRAEGEQLQGHDQRLGALFEVADKGDDGNRRRAVQKEQHPDRLRRELDAFRQMEFRCFFQGGPPLPRNGTFKRSRIIRSKPGIGQRDTGALMLKVTGARR